MKKVIVIGGGYAGCSTARILKDIRHDTIIFERSDGSKEIMKLPTKTYSKEYSALNNIKTGLNT